jgi:hypothetical protein
MKILRYTILFATTGMLWYYTLQLFFVWSGAQRILGNPEYQSAKFINNFIQEPLPRMADQVFLYKGFFVIGIFIAMAFSILNTFLKGMWWKRGLTFGALHWLIMVPWFEFYLPYNVMLEPLSLVLLEGTLWLGVALTMGLYMSIVINYSKTDHNSDEE